MLHYFTCHLNLGILKYIFASTDWCQPEPPSNWSQCNLVPHEWSQYQRASVGRLWANGDSVWFAQQVSAGNGLQPDVLWGQNSGAGRDRLLLAAALVPGHPGLRTGGNSVYYHHLHPEIMLMIWVVLGETLERPVLIHSWWFTMLYNCDCPSGAFTCFPQLMQTMETD